MTNFHDGKRIGRIQGTMKRAEAEQLMHELIQLSDHVQRVTVQVEGLLEANEKELFQKNLGRILAGPLLTLILEVSSQHPDLEPDQLKLGTGKSK
ncbi:MAG: hypothetical protein IPG45_18150 [Deltaproteobacteria bacterium]|nr:hypothetical protein [Deltaproteobacteria bacterium]